MPECAIKKGFLLLRPCGTATSRICPRCRQPVCEAHLAQAPNAEGLCIDCHLKNQPRTDHQDDWLIDNPSAWRQDYREHFYQDRDSAAFSVGFLAGSRFDAGDLAAFEQRRSSLEVTDEGGRTNRDLQDS